MPENVTRDCNELCDFGATEPNEILSRPRTLSPGNNRAVRLESKDGDSISILYCVEYLLLSGGI